MEPSPLTHSEEEIFFDNNSPIDLDEEGIPDKVELYHGLLKNLFVKTVLTKDKLDSYHQRLKRINSIIQLSVIYFSAASSFIQALSSSSYEVIFKGYDEIVNSTENLQQIETETIDQSTYSSFVPTIILCISTYSSLIIAGARHLKVEENENNVSNLRDRFTELVSRIKHNLDLLKPWRNENYYKIDPKNEKIHDWFSLIKKIEKEYSHIIDIRQDLYVNYSQIITKEVNDRYYNKDKIAKLTGHNFNTCAGKTRP
jgi:hypothetical protein